VVETPVPPPALLAWDLGHGETAVLAYALANPGWIAVLDDRAARQCARSLSLALIGTLAVVILAKQHGLVESAAQVLQALRQAEFRLEDSLVREVLARTVGESWPPT
jgi:predicted nucleic acid-binding protein